MGRENNVKNGLSSKHFNEFLNSIGSSKEKIEEELTELLGSKEDAESVYNSMKKRLAVVRVRELLAQPFVELMKNEGSELFLGLKALSLIDGDIEDYRQQLEKEGINPITDKKYLSALKFLNEYLKTITSIKEKIHERKIKEKQVDLEEKKFNFTSAKPAKIINLEQEEV